LKILGICCSPREAGNTELLMEKALEGAREAGAETELFRMAGRDIQPCDGCSSCRKTGVCHIRDDMQEAYEKMAAADGIIFGTPVYFYSMDAQAKTLIDRTFSMNRPGSSLENKVGGVITVAGSLGLIDAIKDLYFFIVVRRMIPASFVAAYAGARGGVKDRPKAIEAAFKLGREMVGIAGQNFRYPADIERPHFAFGTHTH
jgi:multimeric flavodoxin WrbA